MTTQFVTYDVFTDRPFGGNQLAIVPDARDLPEDHLHAITREFGFSETVFLYPPEREGSTAKLRIFTPGGEVPFAGHPVIGTAVMLAQAGAGPQMELDLGIGPMTINATAERASFMNAQPLQTLAHPAPALVARALGLSQSDFAAAPVMASVGLDFTFTALKTRDALALIQTKIAAFREGHAAHPSSLDFAQVAYVDEGDTLHMRMFAPLNGVPEDPATGSAAAALAAVLQQTRGPFEALIHQGVDMGRPSKIGIKAETDHVIVSGCAVHMMQGELTL
ncbi:MAG: PhzF family phenazine biosynthesis protein [Maritimibacter sp.]